MVVGPRSRVRRENSRTDARHVSAAQKDVVRHDRVRRAETAGSSAHFVVRAVVDEGVENDHVVVRAVVGCQQVAVVNVAVAVAHVDTHGVRFEIVIENFVTVAVDPHALRVPHVVSVIKAVVAVTLADFAADAIEHSVVAVRVAGRFVRDHFFSPSQRTNRLYSHRPLPVGG